MSISGTPSATNISGDDLSSKPPVAFPQEKYDIWKRQTSYQSRRSSSAQPKIPAMQSDFSAQGIPRNSLATYEEWAGVLGACRCSKNYLHIGSAWLNSLGKR